MGKTQKERKNPGPRIGEKKVAGKHGDFGIKNEGRLGMDTILAFFYKDTHFPKKCPQKRSLNF